MTKKIFFDEMIKDEQLDKISGGIFFANDLNPNVFGPIAVKNPPINKKRIRLESCANIDMHD